MHVARIIGVIAVAVLSAAASSAAAQTYPTKAVRLLVPYPPGGGADIVARLVAQKLGETFGQPMVVENRPAANTVVASEIVAKSPPDGYTLLINGPTMASNTSLRKLPYNTLTDFATVSLIASTPSVLAVHPSLPVRTAQQFLALAKAQPDAIAYASTGNGSASHLATELFKIALNVKMLHVPYKGTSQALTGIVAGETQVMFSSLPATAPHIRSKRLNALGLTTTRRSSYMPEIPTLAEAGIPGIEYVVWFGVFSRAGTPVETLQKLSGAINSVVSTPEGRKLFASQGLDPEGGTPQQFDAFFRKEVEKLGRVIKAAGIKAETAE